MWKCEGDVRDAKEETPFNRDTYDLCTFQATPKVDRHKMLE